MNRRDLLKLSAASGAVGGLPPSLARAASIGAARVTGTLEDVQHIVVLMQENRSFDQYFGMYPGVCGYGDRFPVPVPNPAGGPPLTVLTQHDRSGGNARAVRPFHLSTREHFELMRMKGTPHEWADAQHAWGEGRMAHWPEVKTVRSMGYYTAADIPFQYAMAEAFTLCDAYHCSMHTGTNTNRLFLWTGSNDPNGTGGGPGLNNPDDNLSTPDAALTPRFFWTTYPERLEKAGVSWAIYQDMADNFGDNPLANFLQFRRSWRKEAGSDPVLAAKGLSTRALDRLEADVRTGTLPQVSWVVGTAEGSEHPGPSSPAQGAAYTAKVIDALTSNPAVWAKTVLLINFDENDGFFDHVPPPAAPSQDPRSPSGFAGASTVSTAGEYHLRPAPGMADDIPSLRGRPYGLGPRVPLYIVSPWSRGGYVHSEVSDHTSVIRFIEARFGVREPNITVWRRAVCGDLTAAFDFSRPNEAPVPLPETAAARERAGALVGQPEPIPPVNQPLPQQAKGLRRTRRLGYRLDAICDGGSRDGTVRLTFSAQGKRAAVFHVYDRLDLTSAPRRYTVEGGKALEDGWTLHGSEQRYDLWVRGPDGFMRSFAGSGTGRRVSWRIRSDRLQLTAATGNGALSLRSPGYPNQVKTAQITGPGATTSIPLAPTHGWYDIEITDGQGMTWRLAGHVDGPWQSISDPALA